MKNNMDEYKIAELIFLELQENISDADKKVLHNWINESEENTILYQKIITEKNIVNKIGTYNKIDKKAAWSNLNLLIDKKTNVRKINFIKVIKYAAVISIPIIIGAYYLFNNILQSDKNEIAEVHTISPGTQKAILTTSTNNKIELGKTEKKQVFRFSKAVVTDTSQTLTYQKNEEVIEQEVEITYNTLETPRGGEYTLVLSDGTTVYLNAESNLVFPEAFPGESREVTLEGEAYFEVTKSESKPFIVKTNEYDIKVYGTAFNVSAYESDNFTHTTLVEGSVGLTYNKDEIKLEPGEQANLNKTTHEISKKEVDTYVYIAWKDGKFVFANESLENILKRLSRWYNTEAYYEKEKLKNYHFSGTLNRYDNIDEILNMIALTTNIKFKIENQMILVKEKK